MSDTQLQKRSPGSAVAPGVGVVVTEPIEDAVTLTRIEGKGVGPATVETPATPVTTTHLRRYGTRGTGEWGLGVS